MTTNRKLQILKGTLIGTVAALTSLHAIAATSAYEMSAYTNAPGGRLIMVAEYEAAIAAASHNLAMPAETQLGASTNLCVAYTMTRDFEQASAACNKAVSIAGSFSGSVLLSSAARQVMAKALTNRGVLRALSSDTAGATADFEKATAMQRSLTAANANLTRLKETPSYSAAVAQASSN